MLLSFSLKSIFLGKCKIGRHVVATMWVQKEQIVVRKVREEGNQGKAQKV